jgi:hypothetical protein
MKEFLENPKFVNPQDAPRPHNKQLLIDIFDSGKTFEDFENLGKYEEALYIAGIGSGKCLARGTKIIRYSGKVDVVENIKQGDLLMGWDSKPRKVISLSRGREKLYKVTPTKGEPFIINQSHILSLKRTNRGIIANNGRLDQKAGEIINISVLEYLELSNKMKNILKLWRVGINFKKKKVSIDPYFLGLWLGDGNSHNIGIATQDIEIKNEIYKQAKVCGLVVNINQNKNKTCPTYIVTSGTKLGSKNRNSLLENFKQYNLIKNKYIPQVYKFNSKKIRLQLLAGLIDSDGYQGNNCLEFSNKNKTLIDDITYLCRSLGFAAYIKQRKTSCNGKSFISYRVSISGDLEKIPVQLERKKCTKRTQKKDVLLTGFKIEPIGIGDYYGFDVDRDHLYLLGDFTVTHNSYVSSMAIVYNIYRLLCLKDPQAYFKFAKGTKIAFINISTSFSQAKDVVFSEIKNRVDNNQWFQNFFPPNPRIKSLLQFPKNIYILPLGSNEESPLGYNIFGAVIDEASFHTLTKDKDYAEESYNQIKKRIRSRFLSKGKLFIITSPRYVYDFAEKKMEEEADNPKVYKKRTPLWDAMPPDRFSGQKFDLGKYLPAYKGVMVPVEYEDEFKQNPEKAMRDYGAQPSQAIQSFFANPSIIDDNANYDRKHPINPKDGEFHTWFFNRASQEDYDSDKRFIHVDLGLNREGKGDCAGFAMGKFDGWIEKQSTSGKMEKRPKVKIDLMLRIEAGPRKEIKFEEIRQMIYKIRDIGYNIHKITFDGWQSEIGSTMVKLLDGTNKRMDEITNGAWIYSFDLNKKEIVPAFCKPVKQTGINAPVYEIIIDNGQKIYLTKEHPLLMKNGTYKQVEFLKCGDSLMPFNTSFLERKNKTNTKPRQYEKIFQPNTNTWEMTHDMVARNVYGEKPKNNVVHHKDFNSLNNEPDNLEYLYVKKHTAYHRKLTQKSNQIRWSKKGERRKQAQLMRDRNKKYNLPSLLKPPTKEIAKKIALTIKNKWDNNNEYQEKMAKRPVYCGEYSPHFNRDIPNEILFKACATSNSLEEVKQKLNLKNTFFVIRRLKTLGYKGFKDYKSQKNHKVVSVKFHGYEDVYDIEVPKYNNFGLSAGIFVHNSIDSIQMLNSAGFKAETFSIDRNPEAYYTVKAAILDDRLDYYYYAPFSEELKQLEEIKGMKIDHPRQGKKDVADAVAGVCYHAAQGTPGVGFLGVKQTQS